MEDGREQGRRKKKKKKKSKIGYYLYALVVLILTTAIIVVSVLLLFHVQKVEIIGTKYSKKSDILEWVREDPYTSNSIYAFWKIKSGMYKTPDYLEKVDVGVSLPWKLKVRVTEKRIAGCVAKGNDYVYFDEDGIVLLMSAEQQKGIPVVEGVPVKKAELYKKLPVDDKKLVPSVISLGEELKKNRLKPNRIVWEENSMNLYFEGICARVGKNGFAEKLVQIPPMLEKLEGKSGVLKMEHYNETSTSISFRETVPEN